MNPKINLITYPDKIFSDVENILIVGTSDSVKTELQTTYLQNIEHDINIYVFDEKEHTADRLDWLLSIFHLCDICIIDIDNLPSYLKPLVAYFIAKTKTYWLTNEVESVYNHISNQKIYNLDFLENRR